MGNFASTADLKAGALRRAGEITSGSSSYDSIAMKYMNEIYMNVLSGGNEFDVDLGDPWVWAKAENPAVIQLDPKHSTGSVSLTKGSTSGTFSDAPAASMAGRYLKIASRPEFFRIATHTAAATAFTLDAAYTDTTSSGLSYDAYKLDYALQSGILRLFSPFITYRNQNDTVLLSRPEDNRVHMVDLKTIQRDHPLTTLREGIPDRFAIKYESDGQLTVKFNKSPSTETRLEYDYIPIPSDLQDSDSSIPLIPRDFRTVLEFGTAYYILLDKDDEKKNEYLALCQQKLRAMVAENRREMTNASTQKGLLKPRQDYLQIFDLRIGP